MTLFMKMRKIGYSCDDDLEIDQHKTANFNTTNTDFHTKKFLIVKKHPNYFVCYNFKTKDINQSSF